MLPASAHLRDLEAEAIYIVREVAAEFERPVLLFSGGKDSIVLLRLAEKAFWPARIPFSVMHIDTGHNFDEVLAFRDRRLDAVRNALMAGTADEISVTRVAEDYGLYHLGRFSHDYRLRFHELPTRTLKS